MNGALGEESPLQRMVRTTETEFWHDGVAVAELEDAMAHGAVGATSNPVFIFQELAREHRVWQKRARELRLEHPTWSIADVAWALYAEVARRAAEVLRPVHERENGREGYLSVQVDPTQYANPRAMIDQAVAFAGIADNVRVKLPVTKAGVEAIERATALGVNVTATVCFSVSQAIATAEAVERGLRARAVAGHDVAKMRPVCVVMIGRLDDWLRALVERDGIIVDPDIVNWAGVAVMKKVYRIFRERGYSARLLVAAFRNHYPWSQFIGGDLSVTITYPWQRRLNASRVEVRRRIDDPVDPAIIEALSQAFSDFRCAYTDDGLTMEEFDSFPPTVGTLRFFIKGYYDLLSLVTDFLLPNPELAPTAV